MSQDYPTISVCMATLNAQATLTECLDRLFKQNYPMSKIELIIGDGGSTDKTLDIIKNFEGRVFYNPLKTGEAGKAIAVKQAQNELILILDSDNLLPDKNWLKKMVEPFADPDIQISEPISFTWRKQAGYIERYCALIGANDPLCLFLGNYDRWNYLTKKWTEVNHQAVERKNYFKIRLSQAGLPTIGANGTFFRRNFLQPRIKGDYLFDIDIIAQAILQQGQLQIAKVKTSIIHTFCEADFNKFIKKQQRRIQDYIFHQKKQNRTFDWQQYEFGGNNFNKSVKFIVCTLLIFPLLSQAIQGYWHKRDWAWFFHIPACWATLIIYSLGKIKGIFKQAEFKRQDWRQ